MSDDKKYRGPSMSQETANKIEAHSSLCLSTYNALLEHRQILLSALDTAEGEETHYSNDETIVSNIRRAREFLSNLTDIK